MTILKAYFASVGEDTGALVHGETPGKAKYRFLNVEPSGNLEPGDYTAIQLRRLPACDDKPFSYEDCKKSGFEWLDEYGNPLNEKYFTNDCNCELCMPRSKSFPIQPVLPEVKHG